MTKEIKVSRNTDVTIKASLHSISLQWYSFIRFSHVNRKLHGSGEHSLISVKKYLQLSYLCNDMTALFIYNFSPYELILKLPPRMSQCVSAFTAQAQAEGWVFEWQLHCKTLDNECEYHRSSEMTIINGCPAS